MTYQQTYGTTAKAFHWLILFLLIIQFPIGWLMPDIKRDMQPGAPMNLHISIGITVLALMTARFIWRLGHPVAPDPGLPAWQKAASVSVHLLLYAVVFATTVVGWIFASARGWPLSLFGVIPLPKLVEVNSPFGRAVGEYHWKLTFVLLAVIAVHFLGAMIHLLVYRDRVVHRMLPGSRAPAT